MKFALNNRYLFESPFAAFIIGFTLTNVVIYLELLTIWSLCAAKGVMPALSLFVVLMIIIEFDDFVSDSLKVDELKEFSQMLMAQEKLKKL